MTPTGAAAGRMIEANGLRLHCLEHGQPGRPALLLTHGITAHAHVWDPFAAELAGDFSILSLDQRGHGDSDKPSAGYGAEEYAADMLGLIEALGLDQVALVGHSLGARNSLVLAAGQPARVRAVIAVEFGPWIATERFDALDQRVLAAPRTFAGEEEAIAYLAGRYTRHSRAALEIRARFGLRPLPDGRVGWKYRPEAVAQTLAGLRADFGPECRRVAVPALVLRGSESSMYDGAAFERLQAERPDFEFLEVHGATHYIPEERPRWLAGIVRDFVGRSAAA